MADRLGWKLSIVSCNLTDHSNLIVFPMLPSFFLFLVLVALLRHTHISKFASSRHPDLITQCPHRHSRIPLCTLGKLPLSNRTRSSSSVCRFRVCFTFHSHSHLTFHPCLSPSLAKITHTSEDHPSFVSPKRHIPLRSNSCSYRHL